MGATVECWFDYSSPFAYLGVARVEAVAHEAGAEVRFEPFLLGALFHAIGTPVVPLASFSEAKQRHMRFDLERHADVHGLPFRFTSHFPLRTVDALRLTLLAPEARRPALVHRLMRCAWVDGENLTERSVLEAALSDAGVDAALLERVSDPDVKALLRARTERARALGIPGAPTFVVGDHVYWGQDRLDFVARALGGRPPRETS